MIVDEGNSHAEVTNDRAGLIHGNSQRKRSSELRSVDPAGEVRESIHVDLVIPTADLTGAS